MIGFEQSEVRESSLPSRSRSAVVGPAAATLFVVCTLGFVGLRAAGHAPQTTLIDLGEGAIASTVLLAQSCSNEVWAQCGGTGFAGETCCGPDEHCVARASEYSQCEPDCITATWGQCGGSIYFPAERRCCRPGDECIKRGDLFYQCVPACATAPLGPCGGKYHTGDQCCPKGYECKEKNQYISLCQAAAERSSRARGAL